MTNNNPNTSLHYRQQSNDTFALQKPNQISEAHKMLTIYPRL